MDIPQKVYGQVFYDNQQAGSYRSACIILREIIDTLAPVSVVDVGCGRGTWLKGCLDLGVREVAGYDGPWAIDAGLLVDKSLFHAINLEHPLPTIPRCDLAISLEVIEHLTDSSGRMLINELTQASDCVLFSGAIPHQGGENHINERWHTYWDGVFKEHHYVGFDYLRDLFWSDSRIEWWYRQNTIVYAKEDSPAYFRLVRRVGAITPILDKVHPEKYIQLTQEIQAARTQKQKSGRGLRGLLGS
ncbi:MAG: hypothetical protein IPP44_26265 [Ideonella sp.]|nr:hypothetical protein [Ideonella sp.]